MKLKAYPTGIDNHWILVDVYGDEGCATVTATDERKLKLELADVAIRVYGWHRPEIVIAAKGGAA